MDRWMTVSEVCERLSISRWTVYRMIKERHVATAKIGGCRRISEASLSAYMANLAEDVA